MSVVKGLDRVSVIVAVAVAAVVFYFLGNTMVSSPSLFLFTLAAFVATLVFFRVATRVFRLVSIWIIKGFKEA